MKKLFIPFLFILLASCSQNPKNFSSVTIGMNSENVLAIAGEPDKKRDVGIATLWVYENADRTLVFRQDTVYDIITSANARIDSIQNSLDKIGDRLENQAEKAGDKLDSLGQELRN